MAFCSAPAAAAAATVVAPTVSAAAGMLRLELPLPLLLQRHGLLRPAANASPPPVAVGIKQLLPAATAPILVSCLSRQPAANDSTLTPPPFTHHHSLLQPT